MIFLVGNNSRLSIAFKNLLGKSCVTFSSRNLSWLSETESLLAPEIILCTGALTDPKCTRDEFYDVNISLPLRIANRFSSAKLVTFGTIMELSNLYIDSKRQLSSELLTKVEYFKHYRLHTLYGIGLPKSHMFLGSVYEALKTGHTFTMSSGTQHREYHHYSDIAEYVLQSYNTKENYTNCSSGNSVTLLDIVTSVKNDIDPSFDVILDKTLDQTNETFGTWPMNNSFLSCTRPPLKGITNYLINCLEGKVN